MIRALFLQCGNRVRRRSHVADTMLACTAEALRRSLLAEKIVSREPYDAISPVRRK
jgi:hypothetical protein